MQLNKALLVAALAALAWRADGRAVARDDVKGVQSLQPDEARDDPFFDNNPQYDFAYRIRDEETGDTKDQTEERHGDAVHGSYSLVDPDGTLRVVKYTADDEHGFNAVVSLTPGHSKPIVPAFKSFARVAPTSVAQHHMDVPVPVQHHVLTSSSQQALDNRRVLVQHPAYQSGVLMHQHVIQPPLALGVHQDVHHLIPQNAYQLHRIHQVPGSGVHHQTLPLVQEVRVQEQQQDVLKLHEFPTPMVPQQDPSLLNQQEAAVMLAQQALQPQQGPQQGLQQGLQQDLLHQNIQQGAIQQGIPQPDVQTGVLQQVFIQPGLQHDLPQGFLQQAAPQPVPQQGSTQQQDVNQNPQQDISKDVQQGNLNQEPQEQNIVLPEQQDKLLQVKADPASLPVVDLRQSAPSVTAAQLDQLQLRSLDGEGRAQQEAQQRVLLLPQVQHVVHEVQQVQHAVPHQRTLAVYRTSAASDGTPTSNFIRFSSPYAQYTIS